MFDGEECGQIIFEDAQFFYKDSNIYHQLYDVADSLEIVGNIYENKDLLK